MQDTTGFTPEASSSISLREYGDVLRRRRAIILQTFVIVLVAGVLVTLFTAPTYRATARLLVDPQGMYINQINSSDPLADLFRINQQYSIATQIQLLQKPEMQKAVAAKLNTPLLPSMTVSGIEGTSIIEVAAEGDNPELVAQAPNALLEIYADEVAGNSKKDLQKGLELAQNNSKAFGDKLKKVEDDLARFKQKANVIQFEQSRGAAVQGVSSLQNAYQSALVESELLQAKVSATRAALAGLPKTTSELVSLNADPKLIALDDEITGLLLKRKDLALRIQPGQPEFQNLDAQIKILSDRRANLEKSSSDRNSRKNPVVRGYEDDLTRNTVQAAVLAKQTSVLGNQLAAAKKRLANFPAWERTYSDLQRQHDDYLQRYKDFSSKLTDLELRANTTRASASVMTRAEVPTSPIRPKKAQQIVLAGLLGLVFGLCLALLQELFDDRINSPEEAERVLRLPSLGHVPMIEEEGLRLIKDISTFSPLMESYRSLRTNINFAAVGTSVRSIVVTSSVPAEGKSTTVANLAMAMALDNKKVIIVDADLRRPSQHKLFKIDSSPGLTDILVGTHSLEEVMRASTVPNVSVVPAGSPPPNPAELLGSAAMGKLLAHLETIADVVLFDSPPSLAVADSVVLSARTGGVLLVVGYGETKKTNTKKALDILFRANANVLGTVLNRMDGPSSGYYYGKYYVPATDRVLTGSGNGSGANGSSGGSGSAPAALYGNTADEPAAAGALTGGGSSSGGGENEKKD